MLCRACVRALCMCVLVSELPFECVPVCICVCSEQQGQDRGAGRRGRAATALHVHQPEDLLTGTATYTSVPMQASEGHVYVDVHMSMFVCSDYHTRGSLDGGRQYNR